MSGIDILNGKRTLYEVLRRMKTQELAFWHTWLDKASEAQDGLTRDMFTDMHRKAYENYKALGIVIDGLSVEDASMIVSPEAPKEDN